MKFYHCAHGFYNTDFCPCGLTRQVDVVRVILHSTEPSAVKAVRDTLQQLPMGGGELIESYGNYYVEDGFVAFACENQGYVKEVVR